MSEMDTGPEASTEQQRTFVLLAARDLDYSYSTSAWLALVFLLLGIFCAAMFADRPPPDISLTLMLTPMLVTTVLFPVVAGLFYRGHFTQIVEKALRDPGTYLAGSTGMIPARIPVFSDGAYPVVLTYVIIMSVAIAVIGGGEYLFISLVFQLPPTLAGAYLAAAWVWYREGRRALLCRLALAETESLPSTRDLKAWKREHRGDDALLPSPSPVDQAVAVTESEQAVFEREMELSSRLRRGWLWLAACVASFSTVALLGLSDHLLRLGIVVVVQGFVALPCVLHSHNRHLRHIRERPRWFVYMRTHRPRRLKHQRTADPMESIWKILVFAALIGSGAYGTMSDTAATGWGWGLIATALFPFAAFNLLDAIIWRDATWRELTEQVGVHVDQLMLKLSYHWSWLHGWRKYGTGI